MRYRNVSFMNVLYGCAIALSSATHAGAQQTEATDVLEAYHHLRLRITSTTGGDTTILVSQSMFVHGTNLNFVAEGRSAPSEIPIATISRIESLRPERSIAEQEVYAVERAGTMLGGVLVARHMARHGGFSLSSVMLVSMGTAAVQIPLVSATSKFFERGRWMTIFVRQP